MRFAKTFLAVFGLALAAAAAIPAASAPAENNAIIFDDGSGLIILTDEYIII